MVETMTKALDYIEEHLTDDIDYLEISRIALCSTYHFQRMFTFIAGIPLSEYIRRRRLTLAAYDLQNGQERIIDIAGKYRYQSADAFSRAFQTLHHITPSAARKGGVSLKAYPRIWFTLSLKGTLEMNYRIEEKPAFVIIGMKERFSYLDNLGQSVGQMWRDLPTEIYEQLNLLTDVSAPELVGVYSEMYEDNTTDYYIGVISQKECPENLVLLDIPACTWAVFEITGALPDAMRDIWARIFSEWFPATGYEHGVQPEIEWYSRGDMSSEDYRSEIWIPVVKRG